MKKEISNLLKDKKLDFIESVKKRLTIKAKTEKEVYKRKNATRFISESAKGADLIWFDTKKWKDGSPLFDKLDDLLYSTKSKLESGDDYNRSETHVGVNRNNKRIIDFLTKNAVKLDDPSKDLETYESQANLFNIKLANSLGMSPSKLEKNGNSYQMEYRLGMIYDYDSSQYTEYGEKLKKLANALYNNLPNNMFTGVGVGPGEKGWVYFALSYKK